MHKIYEFCKNSERIYCSTNNIDSIKDLNMKIDIYKEEILCSRFSVNNDCIFNFKFDINTTLDEQIYLMKTIEMFYPNTFTWRFDGHAIELLGVVKNKTENLGRLSRYRGFQGFIKTLRTRLTDILKFRELYTLTPKHIDDKIFATGSLNLKTNLFVVPINPTDTKFEIFAKSNKRCIPDVSIKELDLNFWVKEINPDFFKPPQLKTEKKYPLTPNIMNKYPNCIKNISALQKKGNYNRFLLSTFLLAVHTERDAKYQLDIMLNDDERNHINNGNCKDQWRAIMAKKYAPPSCRTMIQCMHCKYDCGRAAPSILEDKEEKEK